jgi:hypothetical protein
MQLAHMKAEVVKGGVRVRVRVVVMAVGVVPCSTQPTRPGTVQ